MDPDSSSDPAAPQKRPIMLEKDMMMMSHVRMAERMKNIPRSRQKCVGNCVDVSEVDRRLRPSGSLTISGIYPRRRPKIAQNCHRVSPYASGESLHSQDQTQLLVSTFEGASPPTHNGLAVSQKQLRLSPSYAEQTPSTPPSLGVTIQGRPPGGLTTQTHVKADTQGTQGGTVA